VPIYDDAHMEITPRELRDIEIHSEIRGYSRDEVNDLLERAAQAIEAANQRVTQLQDRLTSAQSEAVRTRETEDILHRTLLLAQRAADEAVAEATAKSKQMLDDAETSSRRLVAESEAEARRKGETERRRLEEEIVDLAGRRDTLLADVDSLTRFEGDYRERMVRALETDLTELRSRPSTAPGTPPEPSDVDIPAEASAPAAPTAEVEAPAEPEPAAPAGSDDADTSDAVTNGRGPASHSDVAPPLASDAEGESPADGPETSEVDMSTLFAPTPEAPLIPRRDDLLPGGSREHAVVGTPVASGFQPLDLGDPDSLEGADILDDDAFFATLRDAVSDDAPLGPRDEGDDLTGEHRFFDQDADRGSFRDVFRRRR
jgi:cell division septum initiation protein DivIVA